jgi:hypothetical protein
MKRSDDTHNGTGYLAQLGVVKSVISSRAVGDRVDNNNWINLN